MIKNLKISGIKKLLGLALMSVMINVQAEVLVILPESGPMARAGLSIKQGIVNAYQASGSSIPLKFVNADQKTMKVILKQNVNKKTQMIIGPLARKDVEALLDLKPKVPVLALNEVLQKNNNVWQFSLSKNDDALALLNSVDHDQIKKLYVIRESGTEADSINFVNSLLANFNGEVDPVDSIPPSLYQGEGILYLGSHKWLLNLKAIQKQYIYTHAIAVEDSQPMPKGIKFCDVPALYFPEWPDVLKAYKENPVSMPYQRLYAFGGDAWQITEQLLLHPTNRTLNINGRTGKIKIEGNRIERNPICFEKRKNKLVVL